jgi:hypothetical protein
MSSVEPSVVYKCQGVARMEILVLVVGVSLLITVGTFAYQVFLFLKQGYWTTFSATDFCAGEMKIQWCAAPNDWLGLHKVLEFLSPGGALFLASAVLLWLYVGISESGLQR